MELLKNKIAVITGCSSGIGKATFQRFIENGAGVFACVHPFEEQSFAEFASSLSSNNMVEILSFDLSNENQVKEAMKNIVKKKVKIDTLMNVAGITQNSLFHMTSIDDMRKVFEIDFFAQMLITQTISKLMVRNNSGSIVNVSSVTGIDGNLGQIAYSAAKAALIGATKTLAIELGKNNIRVNCISPGVVKTPMTDALTQDKLDILTNGIKLNRVGLPWEVADLLVYLASDMSEYVTGQNIRIDGGM